MTSRARPAMPVTPTGTTFHPRILALIPLLFVTATVYNGPGDNLHWFSAFGLLFALWLGVVLIGRTTKEPVKIAAGWLPIAALIFLVWLLLTPYPSAFPHTTWLHALALSVMPLTLIGWLLSPHADRDAAWDYVWHGLVLSALPLAVLAIADFLLLQQRAHGPFIDPNAYGALMNLFLVPLCFQYLRAPVSDYMHASLRLLIIATFALGQFATLSRGALLAFALTLPWAVLMSRPRNAAWGKKLALLLLVLAIAYTAIRVLSIEVVGIGNKGLEAAILAPAEQIQTDSSFRERIHLWRSTWEMFLDGNRLIGSGLGTFKIMYPAYRAVGDRSAGNHAHNDYLQALQEGGAIHFLFLISITVIAPLWLIGAAVRGKNGDNSQSWDALGLVFGILCLSLHALANFIFSILPLLLLAGLYLARAWELVCSRQQPKLLERVIHSARPALLISVILIALIPPVALLILDGIIFKIFTEDRAVQHSADAKESITAANVFIALRPGNPIPREVLVVNLIDLARRTQAESLRTSLLDQAFEETDALARLIPGSPAWLFYRGQIHALRGTTEDLALASDFLERALQRLPQSSLIRSELVRITRRMGQHRRAYELVQEGGKWIPIERNLPALGALADDGYALATLYGNSNARGYWQRVLAAIHQTHR
jgi:hypothetical protein